MYLVTLNRSYQTHVCTQIRQIVSFCVFLLITIPAQAYSDEPLQLADELFSRSRYYDAITEYKRFVFFNPKSERLGYAFFKMGLSYRALKEWQKAIDCFKDSIHFETDKEIKDQRRITLGTTLIAVRQYSLARLELSKAEASSSKLTRAKAIYYQGIASIYMNDWSEALKSFEKFYSKGSSQKVREIKEVLLEANKSYRSEKTAKLLSILLPGAGQFYANNKKGALNAFILNGFLIGITIMPIRERDYKDVFLMITFFLYRYYLGNVHNAKLEAIKYNESVNKRVRDKLLKVVSEDEPL